MPVNSTTVDKVATGTKRKPGRKRRETAAGRRRRAEVEAHIEALIQLLDDLDGDCDLEDGADIENDGYDEREGDSSDDEPEIGWTNEGQRMGQTFDTDRELDPAEDGIGDEEALHEVHEQLAVYQHFQSKDDRGHQQAVCENVAAEARSKARSKKGNASANFAPAFSEPFSFGLSVATRMGGRP